jgi:hypothetical protein
MKKKITSSGSVYASGVAKQDNMGENLVDDAGGSRRDPRKMQRKAIVKTEGPVSYNDASLSSD